MKVVEIEPSKPRPNQTLIDLLERILDAAKAGDIQNIACALIHSDGATSNAFGDIAPVSMLGELLVLEGEIRDSLVDTRLHKAGTEY